MKKIITIITILFTCLSFGQNGVIKTIKTSTSEILVKKNDKLVYVTDRVFNTIEIKYPINKQDTIITIPLFSRITLSDDKKYVIITYTEEITNKKTLNK